MPPEARHAVIDSERHPVAPRHVVQTDNVLTINGDIILLEETLNQLRELSNTREGGEQPTARLGATATLSSLQTSSLSDATQLNS